MPVRRRNQQTVFGSRHSSTALLLYDLRPRDLSQLPPTPYNANADIRQEWEASLAASRPRFDLSINYYQVLDVPFGATREEITRAYRNLVRVTHPDNFQDADARATAEERTKLLNAAYNVLSRPDIREEYDRHLRTTVMSDALMQRYTGNTPGRPSPARATPRPPAPHIVRAQRRAYRSAVWQLLVIAGLFVGGLFIILIVLLVFYNAVLRVFG
jgi:hypothetical protein